MPPDLVFDKNATESKGASSLGGLLVNLGPSIGTERVRDSNGVVPKRYQDGFLDPLGRVVELSIRKQF